MYGRSVDFRRSLFHGETHVERLGVPLAQMTGWLSGRGGAAESNFILVLLFPRSRCALSWGLRRVHRSDRRHLFGITSYDTRASSQRAKSCHMATSFQTVSLGSDHKANPSRILKNRGERREKGGRGRKTAGCGTVGQTTQPVNSQPYLIMH
jgi:hypothetical protein